MRRELSAEDWQSREKGEAVFSFLKSRVAIEVEFSSSEFIHRAFFRFQAAYHANQIDVGVMITTTKACMKRIKNRTSGSSYERVLEELDWLRLTLTVPIWIIGLN